MIRLIFRGDKATGFATVGYSSDKEEVAKEKSEQKLTDLLSPILEKEETWKDKYRYLSLDENGEVYLDMNRYKNEQ